MDNLELLEEQLKSNEINIEYKRVEGFDGIYRICEDGYEYFAVAPDLPRKKKTAVAYHEAGHKYSGISGVCAKDEKSADKWATYQLINMEIFIDIITHSGCRNLYELADNMNIDETFLKNGLIRLSEIHGEYYEVNDYVVNFCPLILYNRITKQMWPKTWN